MTGLYRCYVRGEYVGTVRASSAPAAVYALLWDAGYPSLSDYARSLGVSREQARQLITAVAS